MSSLLSLENRYPNFLTSSPISDSHYYYSSPLSPRFPTLPIILENSEDEALNPTNQLDKQQPPSHTRSLSALHPLAPTFHPSIRSSSSNHHQDVENQLSKFLFQYSNNKSISIPTNTTVNPASTKRRKIKVNLPKESYVNEEEEQEKVLVELERENFADKNIEQIYNSRVGSTHVKRSPLELSEERWKEYYSEEVERMNQETIKNDSLLEAEVGIVSTIDIYLPGQNSWNDMYETNQSNDNSHEIHNSSLFSANHFNLLYEKSANDLPLTTISHNRSNSIYTARLEAAYASRKREYDSNYKSIDGTELNLDRSYSIPSVESILSNFRRGERRRNSSAEEMRYDEDEEIEFSAQNIRGRSLSLPFEKIQLDSNSLDSGEEDEVNLAAFEDEHSENSSSTSSISSSTSISISEATTSPITPFQALSRSHSLTPRNFKLDPTSPSFKNLSTSTITKPRLVLSPRTPRAFSQNQTFDSNQSLELDIIFDPTAGGPGSLVVGSSDSGLTSPIKSSSSSKDLEDEEENSAVSDSTPKKVLETQTMIRSFSCPVSATTPLFPLIDPISSSSAVVENLKRINSTEESPGKDNVRAFKFPPSSILSRVAIKPTAVSIYSMDYESKIVTEQESDIFSPNLSQISPSITCTDNPESNSSINKKEENFLPTESLANSIVERLTPVLESIILNSNSKESINNTTYHFNQCLNNSQIEKNQLQHSLDKSLALSQSLESQLKSNQSDRQNQNSLSAQHIRTINIASIKNQSLLESKILELEKSLDKSRKVIMDQTNELESSRLDLKMKQEEVIRYRGQIAALDKRLRMMDQSLASTYRDNFELEQKVIAVETERNQAEDLSDSLTIQLKLLRLEIEEEEQCRKSSSFEADVDIAFDVFRKNVDHLLMFNESADEDLTFRTTEYPDDFKDSLLSKDSSASTTSIESSEKEVTSSTVESEFEFFNSIYGFSNPSSVYIAAQTNSNILLDDSGWYK